MHYVPTEELAWIDGQPLNDRCQVGVLSNKRWDSGADWQEASVPERFRPARHKAKVVLGHISELGVRFVVGLHVQFQIAALCQGSQSGTHDLPLIARDVTDCQRHRWTPSVLQQRSNLRHSRSRYVQSLPVLDAKATTENEHAKSAVLRELSVPLRFDVEDCPGALGHVKAVIHGLLSSVSKLRLEEAVHLVRD